MSAGMQSFYGGPVGQSFFIKEIYANRVALDNDLTSYGWSSPVSVGEFVLVSYGLPDTDEWGRNSQIDLNRYGSTYNSTLWQKIYPDTNAASAVNSVVSSTGLGYKLIASMTGFTPRLGMDYDTLFPGEEPVVTLDLTIIDAPQLTFELPRSQTLIQGTTTILTPAQAQLAPANGGPRFQIYVDPTRGKLEDGSWDKPILNMWLPRTATVEPSVGLRTDEDGETFGTVLHANEDPTAYFKKTTDGDYQVWVDLPRSQVLQRDLAVLHAAEPMEISWDESDIDHPLLTVHIPNEWDVQLGTLTVLDPKEDPTAVINRYKNNNERGDEEEDLDTKYLHLGIPYAATITFNPNSKIGSTALNADENPNVTFVKQADGNYVLTIDLPQAQVLQQGTTTVANADVSPSFEIDDSDINRPILNFTLPQAQILREGDTTVLNADQNPDFEIDDSDINNPTLNFSLPQAQVMADPTTNVVGPRINPSVTQDASDINHPSLSFSLPRAAKYFYGDLLGQRPADGEVNEYNVPSSDVPEEMMAGDYYVNEITGFIYEVTARGDAQTSFEYKACVQAPLPTITSGGQSPYKVEDNGDIVLKEPSATRSLTSDPAHPWNIDFKLPNAPEVEVAAKFIGPQDTGSANVAPIDADTIKFDFEIPSGTQIFSGVEVGVGKFDTRIAGAHKKDLYLNSDTGKIYEWDGNVWSVKDGSLKGPEGKALKVIDRCTAKETDDYKDSAENTYAVVQAKLEELGKETLEADEIMAMDWYVYTYNTTGDQIFDDVTGDPVYEKISYWVYYTAGAVGASREWARAKLTGSASNLFANSYVSESIDTGYSVSYINSLIGGNLDINKDKTTLSKSQFNNLWEWGTIGDDGTLLNSDGEEYTPGWGDPDDHEAYSVDEIEEMLSWHRIAELLG